MIQSKNWWIWLVIIYLSYFCAISVDTMDEDASQYISMSREMKITGSYLQVFEQGRDYLDKPPFLFWINAVSMNVFGENNFAFKFPSIIFAILTVFSTYRLARLYYEEQIARISALILAGSQALFLMTNDIRTDTILMGWVTTALWLLTKWYKEGGMKYFFWGSVAVGGGLITKGPIALMVPVFALGSQLLLQRKFNYVFRKEYLLGIVVIMLILTPMCIGLYQQFDLHPEKTMYGKQGTSGLRFFFWTQSFGRITGESVWDNGAPFGFLFENLLWGFLPWVIFMITGLIAGWITLIQNRFKLEQQYEGITVVGFTLTYCSLASSNYQLPHYIYVVLPLLAIITARSLYAFVEQKKSFLKNILFCVHYILLSILCIVPFIILLFIFPSDKPIHWLLALIPAAAFVSVYYIAGMRHFRIIEMSLAVIISANVFISLWFYPSLLFYQAGNVAGRIIQKMNLPADRFFMYRFEGSGRNIHFYSKQIVHNINDPFSKTGEIYIITREDGLKDIKSSDKSYSIIYEGNDYPVSQLTPEFLNLKTRSEVLRKFYLVKLQ